MKSLQQCIASQILIDHPALERITERFSSKELNSGEHLLKAGVICREMAFIVSGYLRMYHLVDGKEVTLWIGGPNKFITSVSSFMFESSNFWNIQALTKCSLAVISREQHFKLCAEEPKWLEFDHLLLAHSFALLEQKMFSHLHTTASERLQLLLENEPELFLNVPHQHIASMLGIAPESLSRLRKKSG